MSETIHAKIEKYQEGQTKILQSLTTGRCPFCTIKKLDSGDIPCLFDFKDTFQCPIFRMNTNNIYKFRDMTLFLMETFIEFENMILKLKFNEMKLTPYCRSHGKFDCYFERRYTMIRRCE